MKAIYSAIATHDGKPAGWIGDGRTRELAQKHLEATPWSKRRTGRIKRIYINESTFHALMVASPDGVWTGRDYRRADRLINFHRWEGPALKKGIFASID